MNRLEFIKGLFATCAVTGVVSGVVAGEDNHSQLDAIVGSYEDVELPELLKFLKRGIRYSESNSDSGEGVFGKICGWDKPFVDARGRRYISVSPVGWDSRGADERGIHEVPRLVELPGRVRKVYLEGQAATSRDAVQLLFQVGKYLTELS